MNRPDEFDAAPVHFVEKLTRRPPEYGMPPLGRDLAEWHEHERSFVHPRVGEREPGKIEYEILVAEEIDIDVTRSEPHGTDPPHRLFDLEESREEHMGRRLGEHSADNIVEIRLFEDADGAGPIDGGNPVENRDIGDQPERLGQSRGRVVEVGAETEQRGTHATRRMNAGMNGPTWFTFDTTHHALWAEEVATEAGIPTEVVPAPAGANARCNLALITLEEEIGRLSVALEEAEVPFVLFRV